MGQINTTNSFELSAGNAKIIGKISEKLPNNKKMAALGTTPLALVLSACGGSETSTTASNVLTLTKSADTYSASAVTGFAVTDSSTAKFAVADAASNAYEIKLDATGTGVLEFDFVDAGDTVTLAAGSKSSGFTTLKVTDGTLDATNADLTGITRVEVASGIKISLAQIKEIPTVVANSATSEITVEVTSEAEATELVSLISAGTVKIFADTNPIKLVAASTATVTAETLTAKQTETTASVKPTAEAPADTAATDTTDTGTGTGTGTGTDTDTGSTDSTGGGAAPVIGGSPTTVPVTHSGSGNYVMGTDSGAVTLTVDGSNLKATPEVGSATMVTKANVSDLRSDIAISGTAAVFEGFTTSGSGNVTITGSDGAQTLTINSTGTNSVAGGAGIDTITVSVGTNTITGGGGADVLVGGSGADNFVVAALADVSGLAESIDGGAGSSDKITMGLTGAADLSAATIANVESIVFHASGNTLTVDYDDLGTTAGLVSTLTGGAGTDVVVIDEATFDASGLTLTSIDTLTTTDGTASAVWKVVGTQVSSSEVTTLTSANDGAADELQFTGGTLNLTGVTATNGLDKITSTATSGAVGITAADNGYIDGATVTVTAATSGLTTLTSSGTAHNITGVTFANSNGKFKIANATDSAVLTLDDADLADTAGKISSIALSGSGTEGVTSSGATLDVSDVTLSGVEVLKTTDDNSTSAVWTVLGSQLGSSKVTTLTSFDAGSADELKFSDAALDLTNVTAGNGLDKITSTATSGAVGITAADNGYIDGATVTVTAATSGLTTLTSSGTAHNITGVTFANSNGKFKIANATDSAVLTLDDADLADTAGKISSIALSGSGTEGVTSSGATLDVSDVTLSGVEVLTTTDSSNSAVWTVLGAQLGTSKVTTLTSADAGAADELQFSDAALDLTNVTAGNGLDKITSTATSGGVSITAADDAYIDGATVTVTAATSGTATLITSGTATDLTGVTLANATSSTGRFGVTNETASATITVADANLADTQGKINAVTMKAAGTDGITSSGATLDVSGVTLSGVEVLTTTDSSNSAVWTVLGAQLGTSKVTTLTSADAGAADELQFSDAALDLTNVTAGNGLDKITSTATSGGVSITAADDAYIDGATVTVTAATSGTATLITSGTATDLTGVTLANATSSTGRFGVTNETASATITVADANLADTQGKINAVTMKAAGTDGITSSGATLDVSGVTLSGVEVLTTTDSSNSAVWTVLGAQLGTSKVTTLTSADAGAADELQFSDAALDLTNVTAGNGLDKITSTATSGGVSITAADDAYIDGATVTVTAATSGTATLITSGTATDLTGVTLANATSSTGRFGVTNETTSATITVADANLADTQGKINAVTMKAGGTDVLKTADATFDITGVTLSGVETVESSIANSSSITMVASQLGGSNVTTVKADGNGTDTLILSGTGTFDLSGVTLTSIEAVKGVGATVQTFVSHAGATAFDLVTTGAVDTIQFTATSQFADTIANFEVGDGKDVIQTSISGVTINQGATAQTALLTGASGSKVATVATAYAGSGANENAKGIIIISDEAATNWSDVGTVIAGALTIDGTAADNAKAIVAVDNGVDVRAYLFSDVTDGTSFSDDFTLIATLSGVSDVTTLSADNFTIA